MKSQGKNWTPARSSGIPLSGQGEKNQKRKKKKKNQKPGNLWKTTYTINGGPVLFLKGRLPPALKIQET